VSATDSIAALPDFAGRAGRKRFEVVSETEAEAELERLAALDAKAITPDEPGYPEPLAAIDNPPPFLAVRGQLAHLARTGIAIVGARNASANGRRIAETIATDLASDPAVTVVSGLARGIDAAAHSGAICDGGSTVAAMAGGIDTVYPPENEVLYHDIVAHGTAVSEMPPGLAPRSKHFPRRNRIVSGLSFAVAVIEAARKSGSLITARLAGEQGRPVLAVPGSPLDPRAYGANHLIREGAVLVRDAEDVFEAVRPMLAAETEPPERPATRRPATILDPDVPNDKVRESVVACLSPEPVAVDEIVRRCQLTAPIVRTILLELELAGRLEQHPGNRVAAC
jgi:DNA processing protein